MPPLLTGAVQLKLAVVLPAVAITLVGALGTIFGITELDAADEIESPALFVATIVKV